jgi:Swt1-like HEPN
MSVDDYMKRMLADNAAMQRAAGVADPLGQQRSILDAISMQDQFSEIDRISRQVARLGAIDQKLLHAAKGIDIIDTARLSGALNLDIGGIGALAAGVADHLKLLAGPLDDLRNLGAVGELASMRADILAMKGAYAGYADRFRLPVHDEIDRLAKAALGAGSVASRLADAATASNVFTAAMQSMHTPWLLHDNTAQSARAFAEIQAIGHGLRNFAPFDAALSDTLRLSLGDWRNTPSFPPSIFDNAVARSEFYVARGFNPDLTEFTAEAFDETTTIAGLDAEEYSETTDDEEIGLVRTNRAHDRLQRFERRLRAFIDRLMTAEFGAAWTKHQTPPGMLDNWKNAKEAAMVRGGADEPLIAYADFTDYIKIIERSDNWKRVFSAVFNRRESIQESFFRLFPIRISVAHARIITLDDEMYLRVEMHRLNKAIEEKH